MMTAPKFWPLGLAAACLFGCTSDGSDNATPSQTLAEATQVGNGSPLDGEPVAIPGESRAVRRLSIDMLQKSLPIIAGNDIDGEPITWTITYQGNTYEALDENILGGTMGKANYVDVTEENPEPSTLYLKFVDDMARDVCAKIIEADYAKENGEDRVIARHVPRDTLSDLSGLEENLSYLKLRFYGQTITDPTQNDDLRTLYDSVATLYPTKSSLERSRSAWHAVCVGLFLSPHFHVY